MPSFPKEIATFMEEYGVLSDEVWAVRSGAYAIKHKALERIAAEKRISFDAPEVLAINLSEKMIALFVRGHMPTNPGARSEWSIGEAAPYNNKNSYPAAMAEKRAKDRVILKLLNTQGAVYSESEADEFGDPSHGQKGTLLRSSQYARDEMKKLQAAIRNAGTVEHLEEFPRAYKEQLRAMPPDFAEQLRGEYAERLEELKEMEAA